MNREKIAEKLEECWEELNKAHTQEVRDQKLAQCFETQEDAQKTKRIAELLNGVDIAKQNNLLLGIVPDCDPLKKVLDQKRIDLISEIEKTLNE